MRSQALHATLWACLLTAGLAAPAAAQDAPEWASHPLIGQLAPEFTLTGVDGEILSLRDLREQFVVIHFGTSW